LLFWSVLAPPMEISAPQSLESYQKLVEPYLDKYRVISVILFYLISVFIEWLCLIRFSSLNETLSRKLVLYKCLICSFLMNAVSYSFCVPLFYRFLFHPLF
jgi:hypothetical protein